MDIMIGINFLKLMVRV